MMRWIFWLSASTCCVAALSTTHAAETNSPDGAALYAQQCASCHGPKGEGTDSYESPLIGDMAVVDLSAYIAETMPEGEPEHCVGPEAEAVARYIYEAFYSPIAQARNRPARVELSRLTIAQHRNALADLVASFGPTPGWTSERGLRAEYFTERRFRRDKRVVERVDSAVDFDFGEGSPHEKIGAEEFAIRWQGSLIAPQTGEYEIVLEATNAVRLWLADPQEALIDARVRSGDVTLERRKIHLLGGRSYDLKLEFFKFKDKTARVRLAWLPLGGVEEVIPEHYLAQNRQPKLFVPTTAFPPDDQSLGYARGNAVSAEWVTAATQAALEVGHYVVENRKQLAGGTDAKKLRDFAQRFVERAFRRPLAEEERQAYVDAYFRDDVPAEDALLQVVLRALTSPRFLYLEAGPHAVDDFGVASWLSFGLWDSIPDQKLWEEAKRGNLHTREQIARQATRMVEDPRFRAKLKEFLFHWLGVDHFREIAKDQAVYPKFDEAVASDLRTSLDLFLDSVIRSGGHDFRRLLSEDGIYVNRRLAEFYGVDVSKDLGPHTFAKVDWQSDQRAGVLSHPFLMTGYAYGDASSPIHRGVFLTRNVLGRMLKPPPIAVAPLDADLHPGLTTRQRVIMQTNSAECMRCHKTINELGFALENFDAVGQFRAKEHGKTVDATGTYTSREGKPASFVGVEQLAQYLVASPEVHATFAEWFFQHATKQPVLAFGPDFHDRITEAFVQAGFDMNRLAVQAMTESALRLQKPRGTVAENSR